MCLVIPERSPLYSFKYSIDHTKSERYHCSSLLEGKKMMIMYLSLRCVLNLPAAPFHNHVLVHRPHKDRVRNGNFAKVNWEPL